MKNIKKLGFLLALVAVFVAQSGAYAGGGRNSGYVGPVVTGQTTDVYVIGQDKVRTASPLGFNCSLAYIFQYIHPLTKRLVTSKVYYRTQVQAGEEGKISALSDGAKKVNVIYGSGNTFGGNCAIYR